MTDRLAADSGPSLIVGYRGLPLALIEAAEVASRHAGIIVPFELVSLWPAVEGDRHYTVAYLHPETKRRTDCDVLIQFPTPTHFRAYEKWLATVQRAGIVRLIRRRSWFPWAR